jgi:protein-S-isoprenylcysteine O-methyltransferase Ste14
MYLNLVLTVVLGIMGTLVRSGKNGARITGAILAIFTTLGGIVGGVIVMLDGAADSLMQTQAHTSVLPGWYFPLGLLVVVAQVVLSLLATITLFGSKAKTHCTTPQP